MTATIKIMTRTTRSSPPWLRPHQVGCDVPPRIPVTRRPTSLCSRASTCLCGRTVAEPAVTSLIVLSTILVTVPFITSFTVPFFKLLYDLFFVFSKYCCLVVVLPIFASFALYHCKRLLFLSEIIIYYKPRSRNYRVLHRALYNPRPQAEGCMRGVKPDNFEAEACNIFKFFRLLSPVIEALSTSFFRRRKSCGE